MLAQPPHLPARIHPGCMCPEKFIDWFAGGLTPHSCSRSPASRRASCRLHRASERLGAVQTWLVSAGVGTLCGSQSAGRSPTEDHFIIVEPLMSSYVLMTPPFESCTSVISFQSLNNVQQPSRCSDDSHVGQVVLKPPSSSMSPCSSAH